MAKPPGIDGSRCSNQRLRQDLAAKHPLYRLVWRGADENILSGLFQIEQRQQSAQGGVRHLWSYSMSSILVIYMIMLYFWKFWGHAAP